MSSLALRGLRCHACRRNILQSFVSVAGITIPPAQPPRRVAAPVRRANFSVSHSNRSNSSPPEGSTASSQVASVEDETKEFSEQDKASSSGEHVPWYLQEQNAAEIVPNPLGDRQALPPLPENPPPILQELLEQLSVDIGLDDLSLIDLRGLDPPPALGANLIMIIGTARSEKHLNVSADRFCRWLCSAHDLRPAADGLMGRNELKIRLRRKARRAKLARNVGRPEKDDGLTTGWICVNVGEVEDGPDAKKTQQKQPSSFVGFGLGPERPRIVVQMLTGEKRDEFDLDTLWARRLERYKKAKDEGRLSEEEELQDEVRLAPDTTAGRPSNMNVNFSNSSRPGGPFEQRRDFHTNLSRLSSDLEVPTKPSASQNPSLFTSESLEQSEPSPSARSLFRHLSKLSAKEARHELGQGPRDRDSTLFLRLFYQAISRPGHKNVLARLKLINTALTLFHPNYTKTDLFEAFQDAAISGGEIPATYGLMVVRALLSPTPDFMSEQAPLRTVPTDDLNMALKVLSHLSLRGENVLQPEIFLLFFTAVGYQIPVRPTDESQDIESVNEHSTRMPVPADMLESINQMHNRLLKAMEFMNVQLNSEDYVPILRILAYHSNFDKFWEIWRKMALRLVPRQREHYLLLFQLQVERNHQKDALKCISDWVPMMVREEPPVYVDPELAQVILDLLVIADPDIRAKALEGRRGQLVDYYLKCSEVLGTSEF